MNLTPDKVQDLVALAFCLEPLADKEGCTTRFVDLPDKPLADFLIAGINSAKYFRFLADDYARDPHTPIFGHYGEALKNSNRYKSDKTVNFGLLEIMFPVVYARLMSDNADDVIQNTIVVMKRESAVDVESLIGARLEAWKSSVQIDKKNFTGQGYEKTRSPYEFYMKLFSSYPPENSNHQWANQFKEGLPVLSRTFVLLMQKKSAPLEAIAEAFRESKKADHILKSGIIADMCAAALFLYHSYQ